MILKWIKKLSLALKRANFKLELGYWKAALGQKDYIMAYPLTISLSFDEDWYWQRYKRDISVKNSLLHKVSLIEKKLKRKPHSNDVYTRLARIRRNQEDREFFENCEKLTDEYENQQ